METEEVSNVSEDEKKRTRKRRRDAEIVPANCKTKISKKVKQHKKETITVKETKTKLGKGRAAANVSSSMPSSVPKSRVSVRISKSEGDVQRSEAVETKWKRSSPLEELVRVVDPTRFNIIILLLAAYYLNIC